MPRDQIACCIWLLSTGDIDDALAFYRRLIDFELRANRATNAGKIVVVIDDAAAVREATGSLLRSCGFQVLGVESHHEAISRLNKMGRRADLVVCRAITKTPEAPTKYSTR